MKDRPIHILLIAPSAPPKSGPESMQVERFLRSLGAGVRVTLVTTPVVDGWEQFDGSLVLRKSKCTRIEVKLPLHSALTRLISSRRLARLHVPDADFWIKYCVAYVLSRLSEKPDVIYSRSGSFSAALLAARIKSKIGIPWVMHLSDPWTDSPFRGGSLRAKEVDQALEANAFTCATRITLTTEGQAEFYRKKYPELAAKIQVTTNMMPVARGTGGGRGGASGLHLVHTGSLYGDRTPSFLLAAIELLNERNSQISGRVQMKFVGNMSDHFVALVNGTRNCTYLGQVRFDEAKEIQDSSDALVSIEPKSTHPLHPHFLPSKVVDYLASGRPLLALTDHRSLTAKYCEAGYGIAVEPDDVAGIASAIESLCRSKELNAAFSLPPPPDELTAERVTEGVVRSLVEVCAKDRPW